ncbi:sulfatase [Sunxiuqinia elliptica]|uniref:Arylsulfatase A-like enzyme n=1 Tax=Sunxiuqinia elliptica TaxID=655355 RepID=A0A4R6GN46_9BACT|nr:sulfatase [Sunxiuqinia elliptica]TDN96639.1 arylsulfatase A-like enzyme [Sunxiuqinia elliptica]TDO55802.1 arylsulfatase A-like enzyme [Sunxiuqinia elliptica]
MQLSPYTSLLLTGALGICLAPELKAQNQRPDQPNVLFFLADDLGWSDVGYQGSTFYETPNIDKLSSEGIQFTNAYVTHPRCVPSRYSIFTGNYPARAQMPGPTNSLEIPGDESHLKADNYTLADGMKEAGYITFFTGKWHLATDGAFPNNIGFDKNVAGGAAGSPISYFYPYNKSRSGKPIKKSSIKGLEDGKEGEYLTDRLTQETIAFIKEHHSKSTKRPFFAFVSHYAVHQPLQAPTKYVNYFKKKLETKSFTGPNFTKEGSGTTKMHQDDPVYAAMIYSLDESLGKIIQTLKETNLLENTIIIFYSDNGGLSNRGFNPRRVATSNTPLRAGKGHLYEGGIRVPLIVKWPGVTSPGIKHPAIITGTDFFPTLLEIAGIKEATFLNNDGRSFAWALHQDQAPHNQRTIFWHSPLPRPQATGDYACSAIRRGPYKLIDFYDQNRIELYNIEQDTSEINNLSFLKPSLAKELLELLETWRQNTQAFRK